MSETLASLYFPPGLLLLLGAFLLPFLKQPTRKALIIALPALVLALIWLLPDGDLIRIGSYEYKVFEEHSLDGTQTEYVVPED